MARTESWVSFWINDSKQLFSQAIIFKSHRCYYLGLKFQCIEAVHWVKKLPGNNLTQSADVISAGLFLSMSTHHSEMFEDTRFRAEVNYISFRLKTFWELITKSPWRWWVRGSKELLSVYHPLFLFRVSEILIKLSLRWEIMLFSVPIKR